MKILDGRELAGFIEERQARQVRALRQAWHIAPKLAIVTTNDDPVTDVYMRLKKQYGEEILIDVEVYRPNDGELLKQIEQLNKDETVHGIIIQLPLTDPSETEAALDLVAPEKDVDGLGKNAVFTPATAMAIDWLVAGYNVELRGKKIAVVGNGRLVGAPLARLWLSAGLDVTVYDDTTVDLPAEIKKSEIIITATGVPGLIKSAMVQPGAVIVDAGTASENGAIVGDVAAEVRERDDLILTPIKGGVGPLTVTALFDNVIQAASATKPVED